MIIQRKKTDSKTNEWYKNLTIALTLFLTVWPIASVKVESECGGHLSHTPFTCIMSSLDYYNRCTFPTNKLNAECVLKSCPQLKGLSPLKCDGTVDRNNFANIITVLNACLAKAPNICDIKMSSLPMVQMGWTLDQIVPSSLSINGSCVLNSKRGAIYNLHQTIISLPAKQNPREPLTLTFTAPNITQISYWNCTMTMPSSFLHPPNQTGQMEVSNFPEMRAIVNMTVNPTLTINLNSKEPSFKVLHDNSSVYVHMSNFESGEFIKLPSTIIDLANLSVNKLFQQSDCTVYATNFLSTFIARGFQAATQTCP